MGRAAAVDAISHPTLATTPDGRLLMFFAAHACGRDRWGIAAAESPDGSGTTWRGLGMVLEDEGADMHAPSLFHHDGSVSPGPALCCTPCAVPSCSCSSPATETACTLPIPPLGSDLTSSVSHRLPQHPAAVVFGARGGRAAGGVRVQGNQLPFRLGACGRAGGAAAGGRQRGAAWRALVAAGPQARGGPRWALLLLLLLLRVCRPSWGCD